MQGDVVRFVAVSGVDGSGKSTFVRQLVTALREEDAEVLALWLRFNPRASAGAGHDRSVSTLDARHRGHVVKRGALRLGLGSLWVEAVVRLYRRQLNLQLSAAQGADVLVGDRYVLDFVADLVRSGLASLDDVERLCAAFPAPDVTVVLSASPETILSRRDPREDPAALLAQRELYLKLAERSGAAVIDTSLPGALEAVLRDLRPTGAV